MGQAAGYSYHGVQTLCFSNDSTKTISKLANVCVCAHTQCAKQSKLACSF